MIPVNPRALEYYSPRVVKHTCFGTADPDVDREYYTRYGDTGYVSASRTQADDLEMYIITEAGKHAISHHNFER